MKSIREKMAANDPLSWSEWLGLLVAKLAGLSILVAALAGMGLLVFTAAPHLAEHGLWPVLALAATMWTLVEGAPVVAKKVHDRILPIIERSLARQ